MAEFRKERLDAFLGIVRKYMQMRGAWSQKDLAEKTETGVSTMSRFLGKKTHELDALLIAKIVAKLDIPLHEIVDFVEEAFWEKFRRTVAFYKAENAPDGTPVTEITASPSGATHMPSSGPQTGPNVGPLEEALIQGLGTSAKPTTAHIEVGGRGHSIPFIPDAEKRGQFMEKIAALSPRQKAYVSDFLNLDAEGRDLMVDLGNSLFRYFRQKGMEF